MQISDPAGYWDHCAAGVADEPPEEGLKHAFGWTQYPGHGPGDELLNDPKTALELGSGRGHAVAALATKGVTATGLDISPIQCAQARERWGDLPGAAYLLADAVEFLTTSDESWDAIFSIWGAVWFTDPDLLLPAVRDRLAPGGRFVFAHAEPVPNAAGVQGIYGAGFTGPAVWLHRWNHTASAWAEVLAHHGFTGVHARVEVAPTSGHVGTLIVEARV